jgi:CheY-like chemotaxis protein
MKPRKHTLLIADDEEDQRILYQRTFVGLSTRYQVQLTASGNEAIAYLKGEGRYSDRKQFEFPSYIITDLEMLDGDGFAVLDFLKKNPTLSVIPVVMLSSSQNEDDIRQAYLLGASSYFVKPQGIPELTELLKTIHDYWRKCEVPQVDLEGFAMPTESRGRPGERFTKPQKTN